MALFNGANKLKAYVGSTKLKAAYVGVTKVWSAAEGIYSCFKQSSASLLYRTFDGGVTWLEDRHPASYSVGPWAYINGGWLVRALSKPYFMKDGTSDYVPINLDTTNGRQEGLAFTKDRVMMNWTAYSNTNYFYITSDGINFTNVNTTEMNASYSTVAKIYSIPELDSFYIPIYQAKGMYAFKGAGPFRKIEYSLPMIFNPSMMHYIPSVKRFILVSEDSSPNLYYYNKVPLDELQTGCEWTFSNIPSPAITITGFANGIDFTLMSASRYSETYFYKTTDGINWTQISTISYSALNRGKSLYFDGENFIIQLSYFVYKSKDGISWTQIRDDVNGLIVKLH